MLYESNYNQYFLEHSWGPWKKHIYISREGESGHFIYKYPKEYYEKYNKSNGVDFNIDGKTIKLNPQGYTQIPYNGTKPKTLSEFEGEYYDTNIDKIINNAVKAAVAALNFAIELKGKAEAYLKRFGNAVANGWNVVKGFARGQAKAGVDFASGMWNRAKGSVTAQRVSASVKNLIKGAGEAVSKGWAGAKKLGRKAQLEAREAVTDVKNAVKSIKPRLKGNQRI